MLLMPIFEIGLRPQTRSGGAPTSRDLRWWFLGRRSCLHRPVLCLQFQRHCRHRCHPARVLVPRGGSVHKAVEQRTAVDILLTFTASRNVGSTLDRSRDCPHQWLVNDALVGEVAGVLCGGVLCFESRTASWTAAVVKMSASVDVASVSRRSSVVTAGSASFKTPNSALTQA